MTIHYRLERSKKHGGWVSKRRNKNFHYTKIPNSPIHDDYFSGVYWIKAQHTSDRGPLIDCKLDRYSVGNLMTLEEWKESCDEGGFIDYDGFGDPVDENFQVIEFGDKYDFVKLFPSDYTENRGVIPEGTKYILWYNR